MRGSMPLAVQEKQAKHYSKLMWSPQLGVQWVPTIGGGAKRNRSVTPRYLR
jgi:hypothetical protein